MTGMRLTPRDCMKGSTAWRTWLCPSLGLRFGLDTQLRSGLVPRLNTLPLHAPGISAIGYGVAVSREKVPRAASGGLPSKGTTGPGLQFRRRPALAVLRRPLLYPHTLASRNSGTNLPSG